MPAKYVPSDDGGCWKPVDELTADDHRRIAEHYARVASRMSELAAAYEAASEGDEDA
jgi:hypothetical protein